MIISCRKAAAGQDAPQKTRPGGKDAAAGRLPREGQTAGGREATLGRSGQGKVASTTMGEAGLCGGGHGAAARSRTGLCPARQGRRPAEK